MVNGTAAKLEEAARMSAGGGLATSGALRWSMAAVLALGLHAAALAVGYDWTVAPFQSGTETPVVMVDLTPVAAAPEQQVAAIDPGPVMEQAEAQTEPPPPAAEQSESTTMPVSVQPDVILPDTSKDKLKDKPKVDRPHEAEKAKPRQASVPPRERSEKQPAPRSTAPPRAASVASLASPSTLGARASAVSLADYGAQVAAHIRRYRQYPASARQAGSRGIARVSYTVGRGGQVLSARLAGSSGMAVLDEEAVAAVRRAQPLPPIPANLSQPQSFTTAIQFSIN